MAGATGSSRQDVIDADGPVIQEPRTHITCHICQGMGFTVCVLPLGDDETGVRERALMTVGLMPTHRLGRHVHRLLGTQNSTGPIQPAYT